MLSLLLSAILILSFFILQFYVQRVRSIEVCCELTGCFDNEKPFHQMPLPMCTDLNENTLSFNLYNRENQDISIPITPCNIPPSFAKSKTTMFIAHGWNSNPNGGWVLKMKNELLLKDDMNVVVIDWVVFSNIANYRKASSNVRTAGAHTALVMNAIRKANKNAYLWCIGHSLGSHLCAHAGVNSKVNRITGLDPAGPCFETNPDLTVGLHPGSAHFVDVMHTDDSYGTKRPLGHIDFYPNKGVKQPGCMTSSCSHSLSHSFFIESIKEDCFVVTKKCSSHIDLPIRCEECKGCALMGYAADTSLLSSGVMFLETQRKAPYCLSFTNSDTLLHDIPSNDISTNDEFLNKILSH